jgi:thiopeptide-type bacteriocin biosynthesis protein
MNWTQHFAPGLHETFDGQRAWLSGHFFHADDLTPLLLDGLLPWVHSLREQGVVERFFFIRYFERGSHLRLRLMGQPSRLVTEAVPFLEKNVADYFAHHVSERHPKAPSDWFPNDSLVWLNYEPETERYGGSAAIRWAERHFQASSEATTGAMALATWTYSRSLGVAIQLHAAYSRYLLDTPAERAEFWGTVATSWSAYAPLHQRGEMPAGEQELTRLYEKFEQLFTKQKTLLVPFFDDLWSMLATRPDFDEPWYIAWLDHLQAHRHELDALTQTGRVTVPYQPNQSASDGRQYLLHSYVHMTNNRLGISNFDEGYIGYLMQRLLALHQAIPSSN